VTDLTRRELLKRSMLAAAAVGPALCVAPARSRESLDRPEIPLGKRGTHHLYTWKETPFEIGFQHGKALRTEIVREAGTAAGGIVLKELARQRGTSEEKALDDVVSMYEPLYREYTPRALEEIQGIARGSGLGYPYAFFAATRNGMKVPAAKADECTAVACGKSTTAGEKVFIGQNKDTDAPLDRYRIMRLAYDSGERMILLNYAGWIGNIGMTSHGMSFTGNSIYAQEPSEQSYPFSLLKRMILEKRSVQELLDSMPKLPLENGSLLIGDSTGHLVSLESAGGRTVVQDISNRAFGHANSLLCGEIKDRELPALVSACSPVRQQTVDRSLNARRGALNVDDIQTIFADHTNFPLSICRHPLEDNATSTTASFIANLTDLEIDIAIGNPCTAEFRRYDMDF